HEHREREDPDHDVVGEVHRVTITPSIFSFSLIAARRRSAPLRSVSGPARTRHKVLPPLVTSSVKAANPALRKRSRSRFASASVLNAASCTPRPPARPAGSALAGASAVALPLAVTTLPGTSGLSRLIRSRAASAPALSAYGPTRTRCAALPSISVASANAGKPPRSRSATRSLALPAFAYTPRWTR